jgi:PHD/YefM family antitoxin component YafN of YafNO toxin-antitoxin module
MNVQVQKISVGAENAVIVPAKAWKKIMSALEELEDIVAYDRAKKKDDGIHISLEDVEMRIANGKLK